jgi:hypothetical protein
MTAIRAIKQSYDEKGFWHFNIGHIVPAIVFLITLGMTWEHLNGAVERMTEHSLRLEKRIAELELAKMNLITLVAQFDALRESGTNPMKLMMKENTEAHLSLLQRLTAVETRLDAIREILQGKKFTIASASSAPKASPSP